MANEFVIKHGFISQSASTVNSSLTVTGGIISGDGSGLYNIPYSSITGATTDRITSGSNSAIISASGLTVNTNLIVSGGTVSGNGSGLTNLTIGDPEDGSYTDGIFKDFTPTTPVGTAIDRFNEMFSLLAPTPPSDWNSASISIGGTSNARTLISGTTVAITSTNTPTFTVAVPLNGLGEVVGGRTLSFNVNGTTQETFSFFGTPTRSSGIIRYTYADTYVGQLGKAGFWTGFTTASAVSTALTPSSLQRTANYVHSTKGTLSTTFYLDSPLPVTIGTISATIPAMTGSISGVKTLVTGDSISNISFSILNVSSYFYASNPVWTLNAGLVQTQSGDPNLIPTVYGETGTTTGVSTPVLTGKFSDTNFSFSVVGRNSLNNQGDTTTFTTGTTRVDTVSVETTRKVSGSGQFPSTGYGGTFVSTQSLKSVYTEELQLKNGIYQIPNGNYTFYSGGPDYSTGMGVLNRWVTFNMGSVSSKVTFDFTIGGAVNFGATTITSGLLFYVKAEGVTGWVDGNASYAGTGSPIIDGTSAMVFANSTATVKRVTFGATPRTGTIYVRIGFPYNSNKTFTGLSMTTIN